MFVQPVAAHYPKSLLDATRVVVQAITTAAQENMRLPVAPAAPGGAVRLSGDRLCEFYFRRAAAAAGTLHSDQSPRALLLGLGIAIDPRSSLRNTPITSELCRQTESDQQRCARLAALGTPTMQAESSLTEHFTVSAALAVLAGPQAAESASVARELTYSQLDRGFRFADLTADVAGTTFATQVLAGKLAISTLATSFRVNDFLPDTQHLPPAMPWKNFLEVYGSAEDGRFTREKRRIAPTHAGFAGIYGPDTEVGYASA